MASHENALAVDIPLSAFGLLKTQQDTPVIQVDFVYNISQEQVKTNTVGTGTVTHTSPMAVLSTGASANSSAMITTLRFLKYRPGQGGNVMFTAVFTTGVPGSTQLAGVGTDEDGLFFGFDGDKFGILRLTGGVYHWTYQVDWNVDKMDGQGPSYQIMDHTKGNVFRIAFQWLGFGAITFMIEETNTGKFVVVHRIPFANKFTSPSLVVPSFPVRYLVRNTTNTTNLVMKSPCCAAMIEGIRTFLGLTFGVDNTKTITSNISLTNVLTIRNKTNFQLRTNFIPIFLRLLSVGTDGTKNTVVYIVRDAIVSGTPVWVSINNDNSVIEYDVAGGTITGGVQIAAFSFGKLESRTQSLGELDVYLAPGQSFSVAAKLTGSGSSDVSCSLTWFEDR